MLRWLDVSREQIYDDKLFALIPMGFCTPGKCTTGDMPLRPECDSLWYHQLFAEMKNVKLTFLIGHYAQNYYLGSKVRANLTETMRACREFLPAYFPLVHPSPRTRIWQKKNLWFESEVVPEIRVGVNMSL